MEWDKIKLINFFLLNLHNEIIIDDIVDSFWIKGDIRNVEELDLCSNSIFEVYILF